MRTDKEIIAQIKTVKLTDTLGLSFAVLISRLPFIKAKTFLKSDITEDTWNCFPRDRENLLKEMYEYLPFAFHQAYNGRGLSALRSMLFFDAWTWLAGDEIVGLLEYKDYGIANLRRICEYYGWDADQFYDQNSLPCGEV